MSSSKGERTITLKVPHTSTLIIVVALMVISFLSGVLTIRLSDTLSGKTLGAATQAGDPNAVPPATAPDTNTKVDVDTGHLPALGEKNAKIAIVEFSDFQCPFCKNLFDTTLPQIKKDYVETGKVKFYYRHYPLTAIHPNAVKSAVASECANDQKKFWEMHDKLFTSQDEWANLDGPGASDKFKGYAADLGLDSRTFDSCLDADTHKDAIDKDTTEGTTAGVNGTPATYVNGFLVSGAVPFDQFKTIIERELAK